MSRPLRDFRCPRDARHRVRWCDHNRPGDEERIKGCPWPTCQISSCQRDAVLRATPRRGR